MAQSNGNTEIMEALVNAGADTNARAEGLAGKEIIKTSWGSGLEQLGHRFDGHPEGPMSFVLDDAGQIYVLDQVNSRVQVFKDGSALQVIPIPGTTFEDIALSETGNIILLDRVVRRSIVFLTPDGDIEHEVAVEGSGIPEGGGVTGLFSLDDGVWVEYPFCQLVRIADPLGNPDPIRPKRSGRFSRDGQFLLSAKVLKVGYKYTGVDITTSPISSPADTSRISFDFPIPDGCITALSTDEDGSIYLGVYLFVQEQVHPFRDLEVLEVVIVLERDGTELKQVIIPPHTHVEATFQTIRVTPDGSIYRLELDDTGVTLKRFDL